MLVGLGMALMMMVVIVRRCSSPLLVMGCSWVFLFLFVFVFSFGRSERWNVMVLKMPFSCRWLGFFVDTVGAFIVFFACLFAVLSRDTITGGEVGLSVSFAMQVRRVRSSSNGIWKYYYIILEVQSIRLIG